MSASLPSDIAALSTTTASRVADELRRRILHGEFAPGQRLKIDELAASCAVSHMPIREALRELEGEGVLEVFPHRGAVIRGVDRRFARNFYDVRAAIEGMLTERCAEQIDARGFETLKAAADDFEALSAGGAEALVASNRRFHDAINAAADNDEALRILARGRVLADAMRIRFGYGGGRIEAIVAEHRALIKAIERRDIAKAGEIARRHCIRARDDLMKRLP